MSWQSKRRWSSPPLTNTLKIHLHMEDFSLKTNQRMAKRLLGHQGCKKDPHVTGQERKRSCQVRTCAPGREWRGRGHTPWGGRGLSYTGFHSRGVLGREDQPTCLTGGTLRLTKGCEKAGLHLQGVLARWLCLQSRRREVCSSGCWASTTPISTPGHG